ncbi:hypothetical protein R2G56_21070 [Nitratireductor aquimarinus]|uniref:Uncharacterized protein n=1 Tax=Nitratireductor aquimarinus TaxID=889300 RepID=A0ABU4ARE1_9HYPH|nr:hypothetical protein [Nitratireductor aquimarinus]MDV6228787.1 hypothetical protein [Nitratireductor aquimarinus]
MTPSAMRSYFVPIMIETLGEAWTHGVRLTMRCAWGKQLGLKSIRECIYTKELDMETLICTHGAAFPISMLASRLKCPRCDSRRVIIIYSFQRNDLSSKAVGW